MVRKQRDRQFEKKRQIIGLDLIRVSAALLVVLFHVGFWAWQVPGLTRAPALDQIITTPFFSAGWVGVEIFFVISGFVIAYSTEGATPGRFLRHRFKRLFPAALVCATISCVFRTTVAYPWQQTSMEWLRSVTFFPVGPWVDGPYWTLPIEVTFYLLVLLTLFWARARYLPELMTAIGAVSTVACLALFYHPVWLPASILRFLASCWFPPAACSLLVYGVFFAFGVLLYFCMFRGVTIVRSVGILICGTGSIAEVQWHARGSAQAFHHTYASAFPISLWLSAMVLLVLSVRWNAQLHDLIGGRGVALSRQLGLATYPLYLLHANIGEWLMLGLYHRIGYAPALCLIVGVMIVAASVVALVFEPRVREWISLLGEALNRRSQPEPETAGR